jgi:cholesterol oxidase
VNYALQFTERMIGAFTFGENDYQAGYQAGKKDGTALEFRLTIGTDDVEALIADPEHAAVPQGYVGSDPLGGRCPVLEGTFDLFVDEPRDVRHMLYRLYFRDATGHPLTLAGFKNVRPAPLTAVWPETSTLYTRILAGHVPVPDGGSEVTEGIVGSGILRIRPIDFAWQLTTMRVRGPTWSGRFQAFESFGRLFFGELWQVFDPLRPGIRRDRARPAGPSASPGEAGSGDAGSGDAGPGGRGPQDG